MQGFIDNWSSDENSDHMEDDGSGTEDEFDSVGAEVTSNAENEDYGSDIDWDPNEQLEDYGDHQETEEIDLMAGIQGLSIGCAEGLQFVDRPMNNFEKSSVTPGLDGENDTESVARFENREMDNEVDTNNHISSFAGDLFARTSYGNYRWRLDDLDDFVHKDYLGNDTLHVQKMREMGLGTIQTKDLGKRTRLEEEDKDEMGYDSDEMAKNDNVDPTLGNVLFIERLRGRLNMQQDLLSVQEMLTNILQTLLFCYSTARATKLVPREEYHFLSRKYSLWDRFFVRNHNSGMLLQKVNKMTGISDSMQYYKELSKIHAIVFIMDHAYAQERFTPSLGVNDNVYGLNNTVNACIPVWMTILGNGSCWSTDEIMFCRTIMVRKSLMDDSEVSAEVQFREISRDLLMYPEKCVYSLTAHECIWCIIALLNNIACIGEILDDRDSRKVRKKAIVFQYYVESIRYRLSVITCSAWGEDVLDKEDYRKSTSEEEKSFAASDLLVYYAATLYFMCATLTNSSYYLYGKHLQCMTVDAMVESESLKAAAGMDSRNMGQRIKELIKSDLKASVSSDSDTMLGFCLECLKYATKLSYIPGLKLISGYARVESNHQFWVDRAERKSVIGNLLDRYIKGNNRMLIYYANRMSGMSEESEQTRFMFDECISGFMDLLPYDLDNFKNKLCARDEGRDRFFTREVSEMFYRKPGSINSYRFVATMIQNAIYMRGLSRIMTDLLRLPENTLDCYTIRFTDWVVYDREMLLELEYARYPYLVQTDPLGYDIYFCGKLYRCNRRIQEALSLWMSIVYYECDGILLMDSKKYDISDFINTKVMDFPDFNRAPRMDDGVMQRRKEDFMFDKFDYEGYEKSAGERLSKKRKRVNEADEETNSKKSRTNKKIPISEVTGNNAKSSMFNFIGNLTAYSEEYFDYSDESDDDKNDELMEEAKKRNQNLQRMRENATGERNDIRFIPQPRQSMRTDKLKEKSHYVNPSAKKRGRKPDIVQEALERRKIENMKRVVHDWDVDDEISDTSSITDPRDTVQTSIPRASGSARKKQMSASSLLTSFTRRS